jgi:hypothetical protein
MRSLNIGELLPQPAPYFAEPAPGFYLTRVFGAAEADEVLAEAARSIAWRDAGINENLDVDRSIRDAEVLFEADNPALIERCRERLFFATRNIAAIVAPGTVLAEIQIVRYRAGGRYVDHRDSPAPGATPRALSLVCYLNDDFTGGATTFSEPDIALNPLSGATAVFPPEFLHGAQAVTAGTKYVITAWYHVPPDPKKEHRP